jgi:hypothetical protein
MYSSNKLLVLYLVACNSDIGIDNDKDTLRRAAVGPLDRFGSAIVEADVAHELAGQLLDRGKDAAGR